MEVVTLADWTALNSFVLRLKTVTVPKNKAQNHSHSDRQYITDRSSIVQCQRSRSHPERAHEGGAQPSGGGGQHDRAPVRSGYTLHITQFISGYCVAQWHGGAVVSITVRKSWVWIHQSTHQLFCVRILYIYLFLMILIYKLIKYSLVEIGEKQVL